MANVAQAGVKGALGGAGTGATIGSAVFPGVGTAIGAGIGAIVGFFGGRKQAKETNAALDRVNAIPEIDPMQVSFADELRRERRMVSTGMTPEFQTGKDLLEQASATAMNTASRFSNPALALQMMTNIQRGLGANVNKLVGTIGAQRSNYTTALLHTLDNISQRKLDVEVYKTAQELGVATQNQADWNANVNAGIGMGVDTLHGLNLSEKGRSVFGGGSAPTSDTFNLLNSLEGVRFGGSPGIAPPLMDVSGNRSMRASRYSGSL